MAFDITKSLVPQTLPTAGTPRSVDKSSVARSNAKLEKAPFAGRSFEEELASETAKNTQPANKRSVERPEASAVKESPAKVVKAVEEEATETSSPMQKIVAETDLDLLKQFGVENEEEFLTSPVAALLAGNLQAIDPSDLPDLVKDNKFLSAALFGADSTSVMEQTGEPAALFEMLGMPQELIGKLKELLSKDQNGQINLAQLFASFGLDPAFVTNQLNALRAQFAPELPALAMPAELGKSVKSDVLTELGGNPTKNVRSLGAVSEKMPSGLSRPAHDTEKFNIIDQVGAALAGMAGPGLVNQAVTQVAGGDVITEDLSSADLGANDLFEGFKRWKDSAPVDAKQMPVAVRPDAAGALQEVPTGKSATFDAFYELGQKIEHLDPENVTKIDGSQIQDPVADQVKVPSFMETVVSRFGATGQLKTVERKPVLAASAGEIAAETVVPREQKVGEAVQQVKNPVQMANGMLAAATQTSGVNKNLIDTTARKFTVDELFGDVTAGRLNREVAIPDSDSKSDSGGGDLSQFSGDKFTSTMNTATHKPLAFGSEFSAHMTQDVDPSVMTSAQRAEMVQKVMDSASYLVKQGSGSINLDLSSPDTGALQIAVSLKDNKVDIKVFTESDPVREAMVADLSRLKESLQAQNVNLNHVEVGVGQKFTGSGSSDQGRQFAQHQEFREALGNSRSSAADLVKKVEQSNIPTAAMIGRMNQISSDGRLQIRI